MCQHCPCLEVEKPLHKAVKLKPELHKAMKLKPELPWRPQDVGDATAVGYQQRKIAKR